MSFTTKKYTRPVLLAAVKSINAKNFTDVNTFASALSPRAGRKSAQVAALRSVLGTSLNNVFSSAYSGAENKRYLVQLLKENN